MVNLEWYRSFIEVYRIGTASRAAEVLHLTQPAVSQHIAALESILGTTLFERTPRKMLPTEAGKQLYNQVAAAVEALEAISIRGSTIETQLIIRLGTPKEYFIERVLQQIPQNDTTRYKFKFGLAQELIELLQQGQLDAAIATQKISSLDIEYQLLYEENFWLVAPSCITIPSFQSDLVQMENWLRSLSWITYSEDLPIIRRFWRVVFGRRIDANPKLVIPDLQGIRNAVSCGLGLSVLPDYLCQNWIENQRLTLLLKPFKPVTNQIWLAFRKSERQTHKIKMLLELLDMVR
jgi:DNA-binding transcriptional LysR family regulator